jgi:hypothetical protein
VAFAAFERRQEAKITINTPTTASSHFVGVAAANANPAMNNHIPSNRFSVEEIVLRPEGLDFLANGARSIDQPSFGLYIN